MNSSNSNSPSHAKERRRTPMACINCRGRKLKCRPVGSVDSAPCERCVKDGVCCEYRPVDPSSVLNNQSPYYQDNNPIILTPVNSAPPSTQEPYPYIINQAGVYVPDPTHYPAATLHPNPHYNAPPSYPGQYPSPYTNPSPSGYSSDQTNYQFSSFVGQPQYTSMQYPPAHSHGNGSFDHRGYSFNDYDQNGSNFARE